MRKLGRRWRSSDGEDPDKHPKIAVVLLAAILAGCSGPWSGSTQTAQVPNSFHLQSPNPLHVTERADDAHGAMATITESGGTLSTSPADGTRFSLEVPKDAVTAPVVIALVPVLGLDGLPTSAPAAAVHLSPNGLRLLKNATLTITLSQSRRPPQLAGLTYDGKGSNLHLYPFTPGTPIVLSLSHFSGFAVATATQSQLATFIQHPPTTLGAQVEQHLGELVANRNAGRITLREWATQTQAYLESVASEYERIASGFKGSPELLVEMIDEVWTVWHRYIVVCGSECAGNDWHSNAHTRAIMEQFKRILVKLFESVPAAYSELVQRCLQHDLPAIAALMFLLKLSEFLGFESTLDPEPAIRCNSFEFDFETIATVKAEDYTTQTHVIARGVPVQGVKSTFGEVSLLEFNDGPFCKTGVDRTDVKRPVQGNGLYGVGQLIIDEAHRFAQDWSNVTLSMFPSDGTFGLTSTCTLPGVGSVTESSRGAGVVADHYLLAWTALHRDENQGAGYEIRSWELGEHGSALVARKKYERSEVQGAVTSSERTSLELWHRPK